MSLVADGIEFSYPGCRRLFDGLSLEVAPGERVALTAPSGSGKTTLCRILAGYLEPARGSVSVDGEPLARWRAPAPRPVQLVWQHPEQAFDPGLRTGRSLAQAGDVEGDRAALLVEALGVRREWLARYPHELSGGELMRICLVRALMPCPRYVILDEATAMLDAITQAEVMRAVMRVAEQDGVGMVVVSHSPALLAHVATRELRL